jgi:hypothetical protein
VWFGARGIVNAVVRVGGVEMASRTCECGAFDFAVVPWPTRSPPGSSR